MSVETPEKKPLLQSILGPLAVGWTMYWSSFGLPGAAKRLSSFATKIEQGGGMNAFCQEHNCDPDRLRLHLFEQGMMMADGQQDRRRLIQAGQAIKLALTEPFSPDETEAVHFPFLRESYAFRHSIRDHLLYDDQPIILLERISSFMGEDANTAPLILEDIIGLELEMQKRKTQHLKPKKMPTEDVFFQRSINAILNCVRQNLVQNSSQKNYSFWADCLLTTAMRAAKQDIFFNTLRNKIEDLSRSPDESEVANRLIDQMAEVLETKFEGVPKNIKTFFVSYTPLRPKSLEYISNLASADDPENQQAALDILFSNPAQAAIKNSPREKAHLKIVAIDSLLEKLVDSRHQSVKLNALIALVDWFDVSPNFVEQIIATFQFNQLTPDHLGTFLDYLDSTLKRVDYDFFDVDEADAEEPTDYLIALAQAFLPPLLPVLKQRGLAGDYPKLMLLEKIIKK